MGITVKQFNEWLKKFPDDALLYFTAAVNKDGTKNQQNKHSMDDELLEVKGDNTGIAASLWKHDEQIKQVDVALDWCFVGVDA